jgi:hypothetical protein
MLDSCSSQGVWCQGMVFGDLRLALFIVVAPNEPSDMKLSVFGHKDATLASADDLLTLSRPDYPAPEGVNNLLPDSRSMGARATLKK